MNTTLKIEYIKGDATEPIGAGTKIIVHICNDIGGWGKGFVMAISKKWKAPEEEYRKWFADKNGFALGEIQTVEVEESLYVANMIAQHGINTKKEVIPLKYDALRNALEKVAKEALLKQASIHMPRIGCGLAGGTWDKVEPIIISTLIQENIPVFVYDF